MSLKNVLDPTKLSVIESLFMRPEGATIKQIQADLPRNAKYPERVVGDLMAVEIITCKNPEAPLQERIYNGNEKSKIFLQIINIAQELGKLEQRKLEERVKSIGKANP